MDENPNEGTALDAEQVNVPVEHKEYACGCKASGPGPLPDCCPDHPAANLGPSSPSDADLDAVAVEQEAKAQTSATEGVKADMSQPDIVPIDPERTPREPIGPTNFRPVRDEDPEPAPHHHFGDTFRHAVEKVEHAIEKGATEAGEALGTAIGEAEFEH